MSRDRQTRPEPIQAKNLPPAVWRTAVPIRFGHCDPAGIVYTPVYFDLFNGVIEDFYPAALGLDYHGFLRDRRIGLGYAHASCDFFLPSRMGERLDVAVVVDHIGGASMTFMLHAFSGATERVRGRFVSVSTVLETGKVMPLPADLRAALEAYRLRAGDGASPEA